MDACFLCDLFEGQTFEERVDVKRRRGSSGAAVSPRVLQLHHPSVRDGSLHTETLEQLSSRTQTRRGPRRHADVRRVFLLLIVTHCACVRETESYTTHLTVTLLVTCSAGGLPVAVRTVSVVLLSSKRIMGYMG